jgi:hypothetical protein
LYIHPRDELSALGCSTQKIIGDSMNKMKRDISPWSLMLTGLGSIIG